MDSASTDLLYCKSISGSIIEKSLLLTPTGTIELQQLFGDDGLEFFV